MPRPKRFTVHSAAVMCVLARRRTSPWSIAEVAEECSLAYNSVRAILVRLWFWGYVARIEASPSFQEARIYYELTPAGAADVARVLAHMPDPVGALAGWLVDDERVPFGREETE